MKSRDLLIALLIGLSTFFLYLSDLKLYGGTWDELFFHIETGRRYVEFLDSGNISPIMQYENSAWFPPLAPTVAKAIANIPLLENFFPNHTDRFHIAAVLFGSLTAGVVFLIVKMISANLPLAIFAAAILVTYPQFATQAHNNVRDIGLTFFYSLTILVFMITAEKKNNIFWIGLSGLAAGLTTLTKQNGGFLVFIGSLFFLMQGGLGNIKKYFLGLIIFFTTFMITLIIFWPYLWVDTISHLQNVWKFMTDSNVIAGTVTFFDRIYTSTENLPAIYPFAMLSILTPPLMLVLILTGIIASVNNLKGRIILLWFTVPISRFFIRESAIAYDQIRHFFEVVPTLAIFSALGLDLLWKIEKPRFVKPAVIISGLTVFIFNFYLAYSYRPYGTAYFNFLAGAPNYINHAFDVEYYGNVYREASLYLNKKYGEDAVYYTGGLGNHILSDNKLQGEMTEDMGKNFDYVIFMNKQNWVRGKPYLVWLLKNKKPIWAVERNGVILFYQFLPYKEEYFRQEL